MAGAICGVATATYRAFAEIPRMPAESALVDLSVGGSVKREAHPLELNHRRDRLACEHLCGILICQVVAALDRVEHVPLPVVFLNIAEGGAHATLCGAGVRARRVELRQDSGRHALAREFKCRPEAGAARANNDRIYVNRCRLGSNTAAHCRITSAGG